MRTKALSPKYAALAERAEARLGSRIERLPTTTGELGYALEASSVVECATILPSSRAMRNITPTHSS